MNTSELSNPQRELLQDHQEFLESMPDMKWTLKLPYDGELRATRTPTQAALVGVFLALAGLVGA